MQLMLPEQDAPFGQQPTSPMSLFCTLTHVLLPPQHTSGAPIDEQLNVPSGHLNCLLSKTSLMRNRSNHSSAAFGLIAGCAWYVPFPNSSNSDLLVSLDANIQLSNMNISPSSVLIFFIPTGLSCRSLSTMSSPRFACLSSSGKYFMCLGRLWGHCCSAPSAGAAHSKRRADGSERSVEICILERAARCVLVATGKCRARNAECCCTRDSRIHHTSVRWLVEPRPRESFKSRGWDDDALAPHRRYGFKIHLQSSESATVICVLLWERELEPNIACAF